MIHISKRKTVKDVILEIERTGKYLNRTAKLYNISGRRKGFTSTTIPQDIYEYVGVTSFFNTVSSTDALEIVSSDANDIDTTGSGIRTVIITYIDSSNNLVQSSPISLNGITPVSLGFTMNEVISMEASSSGTLRVAQGNIRLRLVTGSIEIEQITAQTSKSKTAKFMVPVGYTGYLIHWNAQAINNDQDMLILAQRDSYTFALTNGYHVIDNSYTASNSVSPEMDLAYTRIPALSRVKLSTTSAGTAATVRASGSFTILILKDQ